MHDHHATYREKCLALIEKNLIERVQYEKASIAVIPSRLSSLAIRPQP